jgi:CTP:molybdopterin cytidylyltransferase MocA
VRETVSRAGRSPARARRGHPIIFPATLTPFVASPACDDGLHALPRAFPDRVTAVECRSPGVTTDDYRTLA